MNIKSKTNIVFKLEDDKKKLENRHSGDTFHKWNVERANGIHVHHIV